jgi:hypothetical protein
MSGLPVDAAGPDATVDIRVLRGQPDAEELAAVTAVLTAALDELAGEQRRRQHSGMSAWQRSQRVVRTPLARGAWGTFGV